MIVGPPQHKLLVWRTGNVNFIEIHEIGIYSPWDLRETVDITQTCQPLVHYNHVEGSSDRGPHPPNQTILLVRSISFHQDPIEASQAEKILCPLWHTKRFLDMPANMMQRNLVGLVVFPASLGDGGHRSFQSMVCILNHYSLVVFYTLNSKTYYMYITLSVPCPIQLFRSTSVSRPFTDFYQFKVFQLHCFIDLLSRISGVAGFIKP